VIDYTTIDFTHHFETYDIIFITVDKCPFEACTKALSPNGIYLNIGRAIPSLQMLWASIIGNRKIVVGETAPETAKELIILKKLIEEGHLNPVIDRYYSLDQIVEAHRYVDKGHKKGNVVITVN
jgi:NADPH:quinone reductase-like Zn-dependent oxidoreductase